MPLKSRKNTLPETIVINSSRVGSVDMPLNGIVPTIRVRVTGTYSGTDGNLAAEFPYNIFRNLQVKTGKGYIPYSVASKDLRIANYMDKKGKTKFSAASGAFEANFVLDKGELLCFKKDDLPAIVEHPSLPYGSMTLDVVWAQDSDCGTSIAITAATAVIEVEEMPATKEQLQAIYGDKLQNYQAIQVTSQGDVDLTTNTAPRKAFKPTTGGLKRRIILVTSTTGDVRSDSICSKVQLRNTQVGEIEFPVDRVFKTIQNEDVEQYELTTGLTGVASIDCLREITNDPYGMQSWNFDEKLELLLQNDSNGKARIIEENKIVNVAAFAASIAGIAK